MDVRCEVPRQVKTFLCCARTQAHYDVVGELCPADGLKAGFQTAGGILRHHERADGRRCLSSDPWMTTWKVGGRSDIDAAFRRGRHDGDWHRGLINRLDV